MTPLKQFFHKKLFIPVAVGLILLGGCGTQDDQTSQKSEKSQQVQASQQKANTDNSFQVVSIPSPSGPGSMAPRLAITPAGKAVLSWLEPAADEAYAVKYSVLNGDNWSSPVTVAEDKGWFINWADTPSVVPITNEQWAAHWLVKRPGGTYSYDIAMSTSADGGQSWAAPQTPHSDNTPTEHGFVTLFPWDAGTGAVWLDGRNMKPDGGGKPVAEPEKKYGGMSLRFGRFDYTGNVLEEGEIDKLTCDCCMTDVAVTSAGPIVVYRDRTVEEIRDISVARYVDGAWSEPLTVSNDQWHMPGCPVNGPSIDAEGDVVVVVWYGAPNAESRVKLVWSQDAGKTFSRPIALDARVSGRVDVALLPNGSAMVSWMTEASGGNTQIRAREVSQAGGLGPMRLITEGKFSRNTGFPQMVVAGDRLVYVWPISGKPKQLKTAQTPLN